MTIWEIFAEQRSWWSVLSRSMCNMATRMQSKLSFAWQRWRWRWCPQWGPQWGPQCWGASWKPPEDPSRSHNRGNCNWAESLRQGRFQTGLPRQPWSVNNLKRYNIILMHVQLYLDPFQVETGSDQNEWKLWWWMTINGKLRDKLWWQWMES